jgi:hypothetical protein
MSETISVRLAQENDTGENLDRNVDTIRFHDRLGPTGADNWTVPRFTDTALEELAKGQG